MKHTSILAVLCIGLASAADASARQPRNPFLDLVDALMAPGSPFNGPDRGGFDTLHGERNDHWFPGYAGLNLIAPSSITNWSAVRVPRWQNNDGPKVDVQPSAPELPVYRGLLDGLHVVDGSFLVGAIRWPHEEYVEQYVAGTLPAIEDIHKVPVYWVVGYRLFIPPGYPDIVGTPEGLRRRGKALIIQAGGEAAANYNRIRPPWMVQMLSEPQWRDAAARNAALRLGVPVLYLGPDPVPRNAFAANSQALPQGGVTGYWTEVLADFADHWSLIAPEADPLRDHPQFMYVATYIRARTFLDGFFNPVVNGTAPWSLWDEITGADATRNTPIRDAIIMAGSKRGYAARLAAVADPYITAVVANGAGTPRIVENARLKMDEHWEERAARYQTGGQFTDEMEAPPVGDANQFRLISGSQREVDVLNHLYSGAGERQLRYYDYYRIFRDRDVMQDATRPGNPLPEVWVYNTQGVQDNFWPLQNWTYWVANDLFHGAHEYFDFHPKALHAPYFQDRADSIHAFCEAKWFGRPMPAIRLTGIDYVMPIQGESPTTVPLTVRAEAVVPQNQQWPLDGPPVFELCLGLRPVSETRGRGMWSDKPRGGVQNPQYGRQTPWWVIAPAIVQLSGDVYTLIFNADSDAYAGVDLTLPYFPEGFESAFPNGLDLQGIPENFHVAFYVRVHATHSRPGPDRWPVTTSSVVEFLPPWTLKPPITLPGGRASGDLIDFSVDESGDQ